VKGDIMAISVFDLLTIGIGPSSSHTVGPMRAARRFVISLDRADLARTARVHSQLFGSLGATGHGHGSDKAVILGLQGETPEDVDGEKVGEMVAAVKASRRLRLAGGPEIAFDPDSDLVLHRRRALPAHPNGMTFSAYDQTDRLLAEGTYYSVGGGFVVDESATGADRIKVDDTPLPYPFRTAGELLAHSAESGLPISDVMRANERAWRTDQEITDGLLRIWSVMQECVRRGCERDGVLPGGLRVPRRAAKLARRLAEEDAAATDNRTGHDPLHLMDWVDLFALAVNEENASGGRVVTAPTNGAAGILPAVLHYYRRFVPGANDDGVVRFLLTAAAIGVIYKETASISGAEVGCQGEVGSACSMAAGALCEVLGGTPLQVENAAEIAMEHNLGLTCDPVGGLVQIPCIERNAMASVKAINAARMALRGDGTHVVSLDKVIKTIGKQART
jgi:L-serine dehydratase